MKRPIGFTIFSIFLLFIGVSGFLGLFIERKPLLDTISHILYTTSSLALAFGLWRVASWAGKVAWVWFISAILFMSILQITMVGLPLMLFLVALLVFSIPMGLLARYVNKKIKTNI